ncbi:LOW QUALITY PROTEIN: Protein of unknown function, partial [Gryllus bimaculatus]
MTRHKKTQNHNNGNCNNVAQNLQHGLGEEASIYDPCFLGHDVGDPNRSHVSNCQGMEEHSIPLRMERLQSMSLPPRDIMPYHIRYPISNSEAIDPRSRPFPVMDAESIMHSSQQLLAHEIIASNLFNRCHSPSAHISRRDYVPSNLEYSGTSDSGGEIVATPPTTSRRFGIVPGEAPVRRSPPSVRASSGEDFDVDPYMETVFRKVTVKKRRQETRQIFDRGAAGRPRRSTRSLRVSEVSRRVAPCAAEPLEREPLELSAGILQPDGDDYRLVFISSEDSSSKEEEEEEEGEGSHSEDADADSSSSSSTAPGLALDECDWDYFEPGRASALRDWARAGGAGVLLMEIKQINVSCVQSLSIYFYEKKENNLPKERFKLLNVYSIYRYIRYIDIDI